MIPMTVLQRAVLAHVVTDPDQWLVDAITGLGDEAGAQALTAKVAYWQGDYNAAVVAEGKAYQSHAQREAKAAEGKAVEQASALAMAEAQIALDKSDVTVLRCVEVGVALPVVWAAYRQDLRAIIAGKVLGPLPARPNYPAGT